MDDKIYEFMPRYATKTRKTIYYRKLLGRTYWQVELTNDEIAPITESTGIITGHTFTATARTSGVKVATYTYPNDVKVENVKVTDSAGDVTQNYIIEYVITLIISDRIEDAGLYIVANELVYTSEDQKTIEDKDKNTQEL